MPRWDWIIVAGLALFTAGWGVSLIARGESESAQLLAVYEAECPEFDAAQRAAFAGLDLGDVPPESVHTRKLDQWRSGDLHALDCEVRLMRAYSAMDDHRSWPLGTAREVPSWMEAFDRAQMFELLYYRWRVTGEGLEELETLAQSMERRRVESALWQHKFDDHARFPVAVNDDLRTISPDDPGHRFLQIAQPDTPENTPPRSGAR